MILHRFISEAEYEVLIAGGKLMNATDHHREKGNRTTSVGFCFFPEDPEKAFHWLHGIVNTDMCVTLDIDESLLTESTAIYRDPDKDEYTEGMGLLAALLMPCATMEKKEYCMTEYSLDVAKVLSATDEYSCPKITIVDDGKDKV